MWTKTVLSLCLYYLASVALAADLNGSPLTTTTPTMQFYKGNPDSGGTVATITSAFPDKLIHTNGTNTAALVVTFQATAALLLEENNAAGYMAFAINFLRSYATNTTTIADDGAVNLKCKLCSATACSAVSGEADAVGAITAGDVDAKVDGAWADTIANGGGGAVPLVATAATNRLYIMSGDANEGGIAPICGMGVKLGLQSSSTNAAAAATSVANNAVEAKLESCKCELTTTKPSIGGSTANFPINLQFAADVTTITLIFMEKKDTTAADVEDADITLTHLEQVTMSATSASDTDKKIVYKFDDATTDIADHKFSGTNGVFAFTATTADNGTANTSLKVTTPDVDNAWTTVKGKCDEGLWVTVYCSSTARATDGLTPKTTDPYRGLADQTPMKVSCDSGSGSGSSAAAPTMFVGLFGLLMTIATTV